MIYMSGFSGILKLGKTRIFHKGKILLSATAHPSRRICALGYPLAPLKDTHNICEWLYGYPRAEPSEIFHQVKIQFSGKSKKKVKCHFTNIGKYI